MKNLSIGSRASSLPLFLLWSWSLWMTQKSHRCHHSLLATQGCFELSRNHQTPPYSLMTLKLLSLCQSCFQVHIHLSVSISLSDINTLETQSRQNSAAVILIQLVHWCSTLLSTFLKCYWLLSRGSWTTYTNSGSEQVAQECTASILAEASRPLWIQWQPDPHSNLQES